MYKIYSRASFFMLMLILGLGFHLLYLMYMPIKTLDVNNFKITSVKERSEDLGCLATVEFDQMKYIDAPAQFSFSLVNGSDHVVQMGFSNHPLGIHHQIKVLKISEETPSGKYHVRFMVKYDVNGFRSITRNFLTSNYVKVTIGKSMCNCEIDNETILDNKTSGGEG